MSRCIWVTRGRTCTIQQHILYPFQCLRRLSPFRPT